MDTLTSEAGEFLSACVQGRANILVSGGTGSGKTTLLNVLSSMIPDDERIVTIEDAAELRLKQRHVVRLESRPANIEGKGEVRTRDLVRNALRMRPDRIIVGEVRGAEVLDMMQAMNTGHDGSLSTLHANSPRDAISRVETMVLMSGIDLPTRAIREQLASTIELLVHISRLRDGTRRVTRICGVDGMEGDVVTLSDIFQFDHKGGAEEQRPVDRRAEGDRHPPEVRGAPQRPRHHAPRPHVRPPRGLLTRSRRRRRHAPGATMLASVGHHGRARGHGLRRPRVRRGSAASAAPGSSGSRGPSGSSTCRGTSPRSTAPAAGSPLPAPTQGFSRSMFDGADVVNVLPAKQFWSSASPGMMPRSASPEPETVLSRTWLPDDT